MNKLATPPTMKDLHTEKPSASVHQLKSKDAEAHEQRKLAKEKADKRNFSRTLAKRQQAAERIASATEELGSGVSEATSAVDQLNKAMDSISAGATQASAAAQQSQRAAESLLKGAQLSSSAAQQSLTKSDSIQSLVRTTTLEIDKLITAVGVASEKNVDSARMISELEKQANEIGVVVKTVAGIADQTNLLALNAAIEAARAGEHGRGFAVVADEVRNLAEVAEKSAREISDLIKNIQTDVNSVSKDTETAGIKAKEEVEKGKLITKQLLQIENDMKVVQEGASLINDRSREMSAAVEQFRGGTEIVASAAEEAASAAQEASSSTNEQQKALKDIQSATDELSQMAEDLKHNTDSTKSSESMAACAEELSATIQQANSSAQQIMAAISQIAKGAEQQGKATEESSAALRQIDKNTSDIGSKAAVSLEKVNLLQGLLSENKSSVDQLIVGVGAAAQASKGSAKNVAALQVRIRQIDKIVDAIANTAMKTDMLAVNGGIEAARAGDFGKGFAVVASDIRSLATDSSSNAEKIKDMVRNIQDQVQTIVKDIMEVGESAEREVQNAKKSTANLLQIEGDMQEVQKGVDAIAKSTEEAATAVSQATKGVEQISSAAQQASSAAQQAASAAQQQGRGMQELAKAVEEIAALADELQNA